MIALFKLNRFMISTSTPSEKPKYKVRNWREYNASLCHRGSLTLFFDSLLLKEWASISRQKKVAGEPTFNDSIIQCCLLVKLAYHLRLRQSTGFLKSRCFGEDINDKQVSPKDSIE